MKCKPDDVEDRGRKESLNRNLCKGMDEQDEHYLKLKKRPGFQRHGQCMYINITSCKKCLVLKINDWRERENISFTFDNSSITRRRKTEG